MANELYRSFVLNHAKHLKFFEQILLNDGDEKSLNVVSKVEFVVGSKFNTSNELLRLSICALCPNNEFTIMMFWIFCY